MGFLKSKVMLKKKFALLCIVFAFNGFAQEDNSFLIDKVLNNLQLNKTDCFMDLVSIGTVADDSGKAVVVIPEISEQGEGFMGFNTHVLIVDNTTGEILSRFSEDKWLYNDAVIISRIIIKTTDYYIKPQTKGIVLEIKYYINSRANIFSSTQISIFDQSYDELIRILKDYDITMLHGETDTRCKGLYIKHKKTISSVKSESSDYYDLKVLDSVTTTKVNKDCDDESVILEQLQEMLVFKDRQYVKSIDKD